MDYDVIGLIVDEQATYDSEWNELTPATYVPGWHVNSLVEHDGWEDYKIPEPDSPTRVYAGDVQTLFYRFPDEETFSGLVPEEPALEI